MIVIINKQVQKYTYFDQKMKLLEKSENFIKILN